MDISLTWTYPVNVSRRPNWATSQWSRSVGITGESWDILALCRLRRDLPWTDDAKPSLETINHMAQVCSECPVILQCATRALNRPDAGGLYAGVWLTWASNADSKMARDMAILRLKRLIGSA